MSKQIDLEELVAAATEMNEPAQALVSKYAKELLEEQSNLAALAAAGVVVAEKIKKLEEKYLPEAMKEAGIKSLVMQDGSSIEVNNITFASITKENHDAAFAWLIDHGNSSLITPSLEIDFDKGDLDKAAAALEKLRKDNEFGSLVRINHYVHPSTLRVFARDRVEEQHLLPEDQRPFPEKLFSCYSIEKAEVVMPKKPRKKKE